MAIVKLLLVFNSHFILLKKGSIRLLLLYNLRPTTLGDIVKMRKECLGESL